MFKKEYLQANQLKIYHLEMQQVKYILILSVKIGAANVIFLVFPVLSSLNLWAAEAFQSCQDLGT